MLEVSQTHTGDTDTDLGLLLLFRGSLAYSFYPTYCIHLLIVRPTYLHTYMCDSSDNMLLSTGDAVVYGADKATVVIEANDDANGIFSLEAIERPVEEGKTNHF